MFMNFSDLDVLVYRVIALENRKVSHPAFFCYLYTIFSCLGILYIDILKIKI